jgi:anti-sigma factor RsiW
VARAVENDPALAARMAAFERDKAALKAAFDPVAGAALPAAWLRRIEAAVERPSAQVLTFPSRRRPVLVAWAIAACLLLAVGLGVMRLRLQAPEDGLLAEALAARGGSLVAAAHYDLAALPDAEAQRALLTKATGLPVRAPDLHRQGWHLAAIDTYQHAAALRYANAHGQSLFVFVRRSAGVPRFDILKRQADRICVWQDEVVAAVMMGDMSAGQMMRVAGAAYASLDL